jgi:transcriptional regulator with XRE-family HTH domain
MNQLALNRWIGGKIYKGRTARKISQETLSKEVGGSRHFISMLENGNRGAKVDTC